MGGTRDVRIGFNPEARSIFIQIPIDPNSSAPPSLYAELDTQILNYGSETILEITTKAEHLFREFHRFAGILTEDFERPEQTALGSFEIAIYQWQELTSRKDLLTDEQKLGLQGELAFLRALLRIYGVQSVTAWTGRNRLLAERHDFRINGIDIEIKSTRNSRRQHTIHGLGQLQPSVDHNLYLFSIKYEGAGLADGRSLYDEIEDIRVSLGKTSSERTEFDSRIYAVGYRDVDAKHYQDKLIFADLPALIIVDDQFPRITKDTLLSSISAEISVRINDVSYRIDVEGMGVYQGSEEFTQILGDLQVKDK